MIKSLVGINSNFANLGRISIQPAPVNSPQFVIKSQTVNVSIKQQLPISQISLPINAIVSKPNLVANLLKPSLEGLTSDLFSDRARVTIPIIAQFSRLVPTHALTLDSAQTFDPRTTESFITTATKFQPFEQLTGIAHERPEVVMLTNMLPLFNNESSFVSLAPHSTYVTADHMLNPHMTDAGKYVESQIQMRNLMSWDMQNSLQAVRYRFSGLNQEFVKRSTDFSAALIQLNSHAKYLLNLVRILDEQKNQLDLRHKIHKVNVRELTQFLAFKFNPVLNSAVSNMLVAGLKSNYDCADCLVDVGYTAASARTVFSSSKIWLQTLLELKTMLKHHSLKLTDIDPLTQRNDNNPTTILEPSAKYFSISSNLPDVPPLSELINLEVSNSTKTQGILDPVFVNMYQNVFFKNEEARIAALAHLLTREFRYSNGLSKPSVVTALQNFYGFNVALNGNTTLFDSIFGRHGNNVTDFPANSDKSLASVAQNTIKDEESGIGILTFESKYVDGDTGTLTPGGEFFIDRVLNTTGEQFNTSAADSLVMQLDDQLKELNIIIDGMNLFSLSRTTSIDVAGEQRSAPGGFLTSAYDTIDEVASKLINVRTGFALNNILDDKLATVYTKARTDNNLKTKLFLYTIAKITRNYNQNVTFFKSRVKSDNTPLVDSLIESITTDIAGAPWGNRTTFQLVTQKASIKANTSAVTRESIKNALKSGTDVSSIVEQFMSGVLSQFNIDTTAIQSEFTRYSGYIDTVVMMLAFDFVIAMIARFSDQSIVGAHGGNTTFSKGQTIFAIANSNVTRISSYNELMRRVTSEAHQAQQLLLAVINVLRNVGGSLKGMSSYLNSNEATKQLNEIARILKNDKNMIRMLVSEQQIMMLASTVESLVAASHATSISQENNSYHEGDESSDAVVVLDESIVSIQAREALYALFNTSHLSSRSAVNQRIMTVGIPLGFCRRLKQKIDIHTQTNSSFKGKQSDIVRINVYKIDLQNADIIYKPQQFLFELSRFPVRSNTGAWLSLTSRSSLKDLIHAIPTHNFEAGAALMSTDTRTPIGIEYASANDANRSIVKSSREAFADSSYSFLSSTEKTEILQNHITSQLLEMYVKLLTGINTSEYNYDMKEVPEPIESEFAKSLAEHSIQYVVDQTSNHGGLSKPAVQPPRGGVLFAPSRNINNSKISLSHAAGIAGKINASAVFARLPQVAAQPLSIQQSSPLGKFALNAATLGPHNLEIVLSSIRSVSIATKTLTNLTSTDALMERIMTPKQFDRVFNIMVDPRDFEIDVESTIATPYGQQALELLIKHGEVVPDGVSGNSSSSTNGSMSSMNKHETGSSRASTSFVDSNINNFKYRNRDKTQGDMISDKYFITIETFGEGNV